MNNLINDFKNLHQIPEIGFAEFKTQEYILKQLSSLNCKVYVLKPTGIIVFFDYGSSESIAIRCEMDGLRIKEINNFDFKSTHEGFMHACGHDAHMAIVLSIAYELDKIKCPRNVCLIFQPSEEMFGGALKVINSAEFNSLNIVEIYGIHLWPGLKKGVIASKNNTLMASSTEVDINIVGKSVHIANKEEGIDAIEAATLLLSSINTEDGVLFNCGRIITEGARNIVCSNVLLECSMRTLYKIRKKKQLRNLNEIARTISNQTKANIYVTSNRYIPEVRNSLFLFEKHRHLIDEVVSAVYQAEDFSFYGEKAKILFMFLGIGDTPPLHSNNFNFDLNVLKKGVNTLLAIVKTR